jgi:chemotaxis protein CheD
VFLQPGDFHFGGGRTRLSTLLGSCISITLWHPAAADRRHVSLHAAFPRRCPPADAPLDGRYADEALALFDQAVAACAQSAGRLPGQGFRGGNMLEPRGEAPRIDGHRNPQRGAAMTLLALHGYQPRVAHCGGKGHRKLIFDLWTGHVWMAHRPLEGGL